MKILNVFDPNAFDTDIVPSPCLATIIEENMLGREVPPAVRVRPMMSSGMPRMQPIVSALRESKSNSRKSAVLSPCSELRVVSPGGADAMLSADQIMSMVSCQVTKRARVDDLPLCAYRCA